jgi:hypothetical protein
VLAVHRAEAVADVERGQPRELVGERAALGVVLGGLAGVEAQVLQQGDVSVAQLTGRRPRGLADGVGGEDHRTVEQLGHPLGDGGQ